MIIAELNKQVVKIPTEWSEITYSQAAKCYREDYPVVGDMLNGSNITTSLSVCICYHYNLQGC